MWSFLFLFFICAPFRTSAYLDDNVNYREFSVLSAVPETQIQLDVLRNLYLNDVQFKLDFWSPPASLGSEVLIGLPDLALEELQNKLMAAGILYETKHRNLEELIQREREENPQQFFYRNFRASSFALDQYHRFEEIESYIKQLQKENPKLVSLKLLGHTGENREINAVRISSGGDNKRPAILIDAGIHAREWVAPATALYLIHTLVSKYASDSLVKNLVDSYDWFIVPVVNPDGYVYTWKHNRGWRKNRSRPEPTSGCYGVDPNRNFERGFAGASTSKNPCSDLYPGRNSFSEPESRALKKLTLDNQQRMRIAITLHSFGQMWMSPWGYIRSKPADFPIMMSAANKAVAALKSVNGLTYKVGATYEVIYPTGGGSIDWQYSVGNTSYIYAVELRPTQGTFFGFELSRTQIVPTGKEIWAAVSTLAKIIK